MLKISYTKQTPTFGIFIMEPLNIGQGLTLGNSLRRILLNDIKTFNLTNININNTKTEFLNPFTLNEDLSTFYLNLKEIKLGETFISNYKSLAETTFIQASLNIIGPSILTAGLLTLNTSSFHILNPELYLGTLSTQQPFYINLTFSKNKHFFNKSNTLKDSVETLQFSSVIQSNFTIKLITDSLGNIKETLIFKLKTDGTISPLYAFQTALQKNLLLYTSLLYTLPSF